MDSVSNYSVFSERERRGSTGAHAAMFGWDKFRQMLEQITRLENRGK